MSSYKVEICGVNTAKLPVLKEEEKDALFTRIKQGDAAARETYIKGNLRLVLSVIKRFSGNHENVDDLFQIGCIGLIKSIDNFNPALGVKFSTYAVPMIIGEIRRADRQLRLHRKLLPGICVQTPRSASAVPCETPPTKPSTPARFLPKPPARNRH